MLKNLLVTRHKPLKWALIVISYLFIGIFILLPVITIFIEAFSKGVGFYIKALTAKEAISALKLTLIVSLIVVFCNVIFGLCSAWCISKFEFRGKNLILTLIDIPFAVSPIISGLIYILLFSPNNAFGAFLLDHDIKIIFALPGIVIATIFVTFPIITRELLTLMEAQGSDEEQAAMLLGSSGLYCFFRITVPKIKWGLLYGVLLCTARSMGEFGAVSVVSGHIRGLTNTLPLYVESLYNEYDFVGAFAVASISTIFAFVTLIIKITSNEHQVRKYK